MRAWQDTCFCKGGRMTARKTKKGQEEIIGFVLIVVIVAVIIVVLLGIFIRQKTPVTAKESIDVNQFLESAMEYTSECAISYEPAYSKVRVLVKDCYSEASCTSGERACDVLKRTIKQIIESSWKIGAERPSKGYIFNSSYVSDSRTTEFVLVQEGNCTGSRIGGEYISPAYPGDIRSTLEICY